MFICGELSFEYSLCSLRMHFVVFVHKRPNGKTTAEEWAFVCVSLQNSTLAHCHFCVLSLVHCLGGTQSLLTEHKRDSKDSAQQIFLFYFNPIFNNCCVVLCWWENGMKYSDVGNIFFSKNEHALRWVVISKKILWLTNSIRFFLSFFSGNGNIL